MAGARKLRVMPKVLQAMGKELSCQGDYCRELLLGGPVSRRVQSLNRSQGIYDFVMCGREAAHRWKKGLDTWLERRRFVWICATEVHVRHLWSQEPSCLLPAPSPSANLPEVHFQCRGAWDSPAPRFGASVCVL